MGCAEYRQDARRRVLCVRCIQRAAYSMQHGALVGVTINPMRPGLFCSSKRVIWFGVQNLPAPAGSERNLIKDIIDPYVSVELWDGQANQKFATKVIDNNGFDPRWNVRRIALPPCRSTQ